MTSATCRKIKALQLGTALATTLFMGGVAAPAFAQTLPTITTGNEGGTTITPGAGALQVDLNNGTRVVNWDTYSIGAGGSVNYITSNTGTQYAVLNRVITASPSQIDGLIAATNGGANNIAVWLTNPNGITFGSTGAFNGGALVLTTLGVTDTDFLDGNSTVNLAGASTDGITIASGAALNTLGGSTQSNMLIIAAQTMTVGGTLNSTGETALVAAQDVTLDFTTGSPLGITITTGTSLSGVTVLGSVSGSSVKLAAANPGAMINTLLNVDSGASLTATGTNGAVVLATTTTGSITATGNSAGIVSNGSLTASGTGGDVTVASDGAATVAGTVSAADAYSVGGTSITLGSLAGASTQTAGGAINVSGGPITLGGDVNLASTGSGAITLGSTVDGAKTLTIQSAGTTTFAGAVGGTTALTSLITDAGGTIAINGGGVTTSGMQSYGDAIILGANTVLASTGGGDLTFAAIDGPFSLTANTSGTTTFGGAIGANAALASLSTNVGGTTTLAGGPVNTTGAQTYNDAINLGADSTLTSTGGDALTIGSSVNGAFALTLNTTGATTFNGAVGDTVALTSLTTDAGGTTTTVSGVSVTTSGAQTFGDQVSLGRNATFTGTTGLFAAGLLGNGNDLTLNYSGTSAIDGSFTGIRNLVVGNGETTQLSGTITTSGAQTYTDAVTLAADTTLSGVFASFNGVTGNNRDLTLNFGGTTSLDGTFAGIKNLATGGGGTTELTGTLTTTGTQAFNESVTLTGATELEAFGGVTFAGTLDGAQTLSVNTTGATTFGGAVGGTTALTSLSTDVDGTTVIDGGSIRTSGAQSIADAVTLGADTTLTSTGGGAITLGDVVDGAFALTVNTTGLTTLGGAVGSGTALTSLTTDAMGGTAINGGAVTTTGAQTYGDLVTLGDNTTLTGGSGSFAVGVDGNGSDLTLTLGGTTTIDGSFVDIDDLISNGAGDTVLSGTIATTGIQTYDDPVSLAGATTLTAGGAVTFTGTLDGAQTLSVNTTAATTFGGAVGGTTALTSLTTNAGGTTAINGGSVRTSGAQTYNDAVTLGAGTTLSSTAGGAITLGSTVDGAQALTVTTTGAAALNGVVGGVNPLASLSVTGGTVNASNVTVSDMLTLTANTGDLTLGTGTAGGSFALGTLAGDVIVTTSVAGGASSSITSASDARIAGASTSAGNLQVAAADEVTGTGMGGAANLAAAGNLVVTAGDLARLGTASAGMDLTVDADVVNVTSAIATAGLLSLNASAGDATLGTGSAGTTASVVASGNASVTTSLTAVGNLTLTAGNMGTASAALLTTTGMGADIAVTGGTVAVTTANAADMLTLTANTGDLTLGTGVAGTSATLNASGALGVTTLTAGTDATLTGAAVTAGTVTATAGALAITSTAGDLTLGTGSAGTTATLTSTGGDITITGKLVAMGDITLASGADVLIAGYDAMADTGLIRSTGGDVAIDAQGSVYGIAGAENALPTTQRGVAALSTTGNLTINSDGDARFDSLTAGGSLTLDIAGSLTGSPLSGGTATGVNVPGGAIFATGMGGDVTILSGLAATSAVDVVVLNRIIADRNITINADQLAIGTLSTNSGTITLNDTSGMALTADNYYVGLLSGAGDLTVVLTGQPTAAIPLVATDATGAPEFFDTAFGKTDLSAATSLTGTIGQAAQLSDVSFGTSLDLDTAALVADTLTSTSGSADILASAGTLSILSTTLGGSLTLTKQGGLLTTAGDELRVRSGAVGALDVGPGGSASFTSSTSIRVGSLTANGGDISLAAVDGEVTGLAGGRADLTAALRRDGSGATIAGTDGAVSVTSGLLARLGTVAAGNAITVTAGASSAPARDGAIDLTSATTTRGPIVLDVFNDAAGSANGIAFGTLSARDGGVFLATRGSNGGDITGMSIVTTRPTVEFADVTASAARDIDIGTIDGSTSVGLLAGRNLTISGATIAAEDAAFSAAGAISLGAVTAGDDVTARGASITIASAEATGTGRDDYVVVFGPGSVSFVQPETLPGADIVLTATGANVIASGAVLAASDVTVTAMTSVAHLATTTATAGNVSVTSGTSTQLVGDVTSGANTTVGAGTTAAIEQNVTAGGNYTVTGGTGVTLGDAMARTQQAAGAVTITATTGDITKGAGRLTVVANADRTAANNGEPLAISATVGNIVLANSQLTGGSIAGRESDIRLNARGITVGKVDGASLTARATTGFSAGEAIVAGNAVRAADPVAGASTVDVAVTGGPLSFTDITASNTGHDVVLNASGAVSGANLTAARSVIVNGGSLAVSGATTATAASVTINGGSTTSLGSLAAGTSAAVTAGAITAGPVVTGTTLNLNATGSTLTLGSATAGGDVTLAAATRATLGQVTATARNVMLSATDADINGAITASRISVIDRSTGANPLRLGDGATGSGGFALSQTEVNRLNAPTVILDAGTTGGGARQDVAIGALAIDADTGATRIDVLGLQRFDVTGTISATGSGTRTLRLGGSAAETARATTMRFATTADGGGRVLVPGVALDLRSDRVGMGLDANFLATLGLTPGGSPASPATVASDFVARGSSTLYVADTFGAAVYTAPTILSATSLTVRYSDYALFQNTGGSAINSGAILASLASPSSPALFLQGPNPPNAGGFALFGTINGVPDSAAAVLGDGVLTLLAIDRLNARVNGCLIGSGSGCIASTTSQPPLPPLNAFRGDIFSTQGDFSIPFDPVVGTNNESLFGDIGSFGLSDLPLQPIECDPTIEGDCVAPTEEKPQ